jgi:hypothetical protein
VSTLPSDHELAEEDRRARQLRLIVDLTSSVIAQGGVDREEAEALVAATRRRALELFPGKEDTFDLVLAPRFAVGLIRRRAPAHDAHRVRPPDVAHL